MQEIKSRRFKRDKFLKLFNKLNQGQSVLLFGPRQTGKTTLCHQIFAKFRKEQVLCYNLANPTQFQELEVDLGLVQRQVEALSASPVFVFIDEIQKLPLLLDAMQYLIDQKKIVLLASGSSARKMRQQATNWLPGRVHREFLYPLTWDEADLLEHFSRLEEHLLWGFLPGILTQNDLEQRQQSLNSYTALYLEEEIRREALVRNLPNFRQFLQLAALESGTCPNFSKLAQQIGMSPPTISEFYNILEDTLIIHRLPRFGKSRNSIARHTKNYFFDMGVRNSAAKIGHSQGIITLQKGILFEHFVVLEAIAQFSGQAQLSYYNDHKHEVDLILEFETKRVAVEIKATHKPQPRHFLGLEAFSRDHQVDESYVVCAVSRPERFGEHLALPWQNFVKQLKMKKTE